MAEGERVLDLEVARQHLPGDADFVRHVAAMTIEELPSQLSKAREALDAGDLAGCRLGVHAFQTTIRSFGSVAAGRASEAVMKAAAAGDAAAAREAFTNLEAAIEAFLAALREIDAYLERDG